MLPQGLLEVDRTNPVALALALVPATKAFTVRAHSVLQPWDEESLRTRDLTHIILPSPLQLTLIGTFWKCLKCTDPAGPPPNDKKEHLSIIQSLLSKR